MLLGCWSPFIDCFPLEKCIDHLGHIVVAEKRGQGTDLGFGSAFNRLVSSARLSCSEPVDEAVYFSV